MQNTMQQNLKIICSLDEIKEKGYKIKVSIPEGKNVLIAIKYYNLKE